MKDRLIKDITFFSLAEAFAGIVYFLFILISARLLGVTNFGLFQAVMGIYGILFLLGHPLKEATIHAIATSQDRLQPLVLGSFLRAALLIGGAYFIIFFIRLRMHSFDISFLMNPTMIGVFSPCNQNKPCRFPPER